MLEMRWPAGSVTTVHAVAVDRRLTFDEPSQ
jgi:hypothetical protein